MIDALTFMEGIYICGFTSLSNRDKKIVVKLQRASGKQQKRKSELSQEVVAKKSKSIKVTVSSTEIERGTKNLCTRRYRGK